VLVQLALRDLAIVERLELDLEPGMTAITGETGAGKSILVDAVALALGGRAEPGLVRAGAERAEVSLVFDLSAAPAARDWLAGQDLDEGETLVVRRTVGADGRSRGWINGRPATMQLLQALGERLVARARPRARTLCSPAPPPSSRRWRRWIRTWGLRARWWTRP